MINGVRTMTSSSSLSGLMKWLAKDPWRDAFLDMLDHHIAGALDDYDITDFDELGGLIGSDWAMTLWGCAFEDFLTQNVEGAGNIVDDYLKRRGWKESAGNKAYITGLRDSVMSLYEVSDIQPGRSFLARDLIHSGEPVRVSERTATNTLKPWDRLAMRIVDVRGTMIIGGGLLPFELESSAELITAIGNLENQKSTDISASIYELGVEKNVPKPGRLVGVAGKKAELLRNHAPMFSLFFLEDLLERIVDPAIPQMTNSDGEDIEFIRLVYRLAKDVARAQVCAALSRNPELDATSKTFWNWLDSKKTTTKKRKVKTSSALKFVTTMGDGAVVLGTIELKSKTIELCVNSQSRADRGRKMLEPLLDGLVGVLLVERQTLEQAFSDHREDESNTAIPELPANEQRTIIHDVMDQHYRSQLDQPVPALGNISPRKAAKSKKGREKLVVWLKRLENQAAKHDSDDPMASYDVTWMWEELGVSNRRN